MFVTLLWAVQSYPIEKRLSGVTLGTSEEALRLKKNGQNKKQIYQLDDRPQMWASILHWPWP